MRRAACWSLRLDVSLVCAIARERVVESESGPTQLEDVGDSNHTPAKVGEIALQLLLSPAVSGPRQADRQIGKDTLENTHEPGGSMAVTDRPGSN